MTSQLTPPCSDNPEVYPSMVEENKPNTDIRLMSLVTRRKMRDRYHEAGIGNDISVADTHVPSNIFVVLHKG